MNDSADPIDGWLAAEVKKSTTRAPVGDLYGKLHYHVLELLQVVHTRLRALDISFELSSTDASGLPDRLEATRFDRIEVSQGSAHVQERD